MAYKKNEKYISFDDISIETNADKNRNLKFLRQIEQTIDWEPISDVLMIFYKTGKSKEGEKAY